MFLDLIKKRRSIRAFKDKKLSDEQIDKLLQGALFAPTAVNRKPVEIMVIRDKEELKKLSKFKNRYASFIESADVAFIIMGDADLAPQTIIQDTSIATAYLELQAADMGLGSCWVNVPTGVNDDGRTAAEFLKEEYNIDEKYFINAVVPVGYIGKKPIDREEFDYKSKVHYFNK